jgi:predicted TIM-barrel fold metal-dependent hydrolase
VELVAALSRLPLGHSLVTPIIDVHTHHVPDGYRRLLNELAAGGGLSPDQLTSLAPVLGAPELADACRDHLAQMDATGVDISVVAVPPPAATVGDAAARSALASTANDELVDLATANRGRFAIALTLPLPHPEACLAEVSRLGSHEVVRGVSVPTCSQEWTPDDASLEPVWRTCAELGLPLLLHPAIEPSPAAWERWLLRASLGPMTSSSLGCARLALSGMLDRVPTLDVIVPHLGGTLPYLTQRFVDFGNGDAEHDLRHYLSERLWRDTCSYHPPAMQCAIATAGIDRLMLGTDHPYRGPIARGLADVRTALSDDAQVATVLGATAARWFA